MIRFLARTALTLLANTVGLVAASVILDGFELSVAGFFTALGVFTVSSALLSPFIAKQAFRYAPYLMGGIALVTTLVSLILAASFSDGLNISGLSAWIAGTFVVWLFSVLGNVVLPLFMFKRILEENKDRQKVEPPAQ